MGSGGIRSTGCRRVSLSAPTSQAYPPRQVPAHTDSIERTDSIRTRSLTRGTTALIPKFERRADVDPPLPPPDSLLPLPLFCEAGTPPSSVKGVRPFLVPCQPLQRPWPS